MEEVEAAEGAAVEAVAAAQTHPSCGGF